MIASVTMPVPVARLPVAAREAGPDRQEDTRLGRGAFPRRAFVVALRALGRAHAPLNVRPVLFKAPPTRVRSTVPVGQLMAATHVRPSEDIPAAHPEPTVARAMGRTDCGTLAGQLDRRITSRSSATSRPGRCGRRGGTAPNACWLSRRRGAAEQKEDDAKQRTDIHGGLHSGFPQIARGLRPSVEAVNGARARREQVRIHVHIRPRLQFRPALQLPQRIQLRAGLQLPRIGTLPVRADGSRPSAADGTCNPERAE